MHPDFLVRSIRRLGAVALLLGLSGCVHVSPQAMPRDWPELVAGRPEALNGEYTGSAQDLLFFAEPFFTPADLYRLSRTDNAPRVAQQFWPQSFRVSADAANITVEARSAAGLSATVRHAVRVEAGALVVERRHSGHEGLAAATYRDRWRFRRNTRGELVIERISCSAGVIFPVPAASWRARWVRLTPVPRLLR